MHSRFSQVLLSWRCLYGPLEAAPKLGLRRAVWQSAHLVPRNAATHSHQSFDEKTCTQTIGAAAEVGSRGDEKHA